MHDPYDKRTCIRVIHARATAAPPPEADAETAGVALEEKAFRALGFLLPNQPSKQAKVRLATELPSSRLRSLESVHMMIERVARPFARSVTNDRHLLS